MNESSLPTGMEGDIGKVSSQHRLDLSNANPAMCIGLWLIDKGYERVVRARRGSNTYHETT